MDDITFKNRFFKIWGYTVSHETLLIRSEKQYPDVEYSIKYSPNYTLDIEFYGVAFMNLPTFLKGISISLNVDKKHIAYGKERLNHYCLVSGENEYFIIAAGCIIGKSDWIDKDRLINPRLNYPEILNEL